MSSPTTGKDPMITELLRMAEGVSVLYVEDEPQIREELNEILVSLFPRVVTAENGAQGLELYQREEFLVVITDINMPVLNGIELITEIQKYKPQQAFLVTSAYSDSSNLIPLINMGVGSFILKPLNWKLLLTMLHKELSAALSTQQEARYQQRLEKEVRIRTSELQEAQQQIVRLSEAKDNMLALISHELRTPLNGIMGFLELIRPSLNDPETVEFLQYIDNSARRLERSTRKALDFASLAAGKRAIHRSWYQVEALVDSAWEEVKNRSETAIAGAPKRQGDFSGSLHTDAEMVLEILKNLFENALKYAGEQPQIELGFAPENTWEVLQIRDHGPGFNDEVLRTIFEPFTTGNIMHHSEGMGLGLALIDVMMLTLGGKVQAGNHAEGGAWVKLFFPRFKASESTT